MGAIHLTLQAEQITKRARASASQAEALRSSQYAGALREQVAEEVAAVFDDAAKVDERTAKLLSETADWLLWIRWDKP